MGLRGIRPIVTKRGARDAVDAVALQDVRCRSVQQKRVVLAPRGLVLRSRVWRRPGPTRREPANDGDGKVMDAGERATSGQTIAQGMLWRKKINKINNKNCWCPPLCRDPCKPLASF